MKKNQSYMFRSEKKKKKKKKTLSIVLIVIGAFFILSAVAWIWWNDWDVEKSYTQIEEAIVHRFPSNEKEPNQSLEAGDENHEDDKSSTETNAEEELTTEEAIQYIEGQELPGKPTYIEGILIANKRNPLPSTFAPGESKEAREAFDKMAAAASLENFQLVAFSTYRSFEYQTDLYDRYVERDGVEEADRYSARPGYSEHQTGLAFDIGEVNKEQDWASASFGETEAGKWIAQNAHLFGFIMRYPEGKEPITGYMHESWHFRYVGEEIAKDIYENDRTLEEYLGL